MGFSIWLRGEVSMDWRQLTTILTTMPTDLGLLCLMNIDWKCENIKENWPLFTTISVFLIFQIPPSAPEKRLWEIRVFFNFKEAFFEAGFELARQWIRPQWGVKTGLTEGPSRPKRQLPPGDAGKSLIPFRESGFFYCLKKGRCTGKMRAHVKRKKSSVLGASEDMKKYTLLQ